MMLQTNTMANNNIYCMDPNALFRAWCAKETLIIMAAIISRIPEKLPTVNVLFRSDCCFHDENLGMSDPQKL